MKRGMLCAACRAAPSSKAEPGLHLRLAYAQRLLLRSCGTQRPRSSSICSAAPARSASHGVTPSFANAHLRMRNRRVGDGDISCSIETQEHFFSAEKQPDSHLDRGCLRTVCVA